MKTNSKSVPDLDAGSFRLVPEREAINPMAPPSTVLSSATKKNETLSPPTILGNYVRENFFKVFVGGIGTELTSKDVVNAFKGVGVDIINKPVRILRGKKFNFACGVEIRNEEQWKRLITMKQLAIDGSVLDIRPHKEKMNQSKSGNVTTSRESIQRNKSREDTLSIERINRLKLKLYELKLMAAENLLMKAKIDGQVRSCKNSIEDEKMRVYSRSYNTPQPRVTESSRTFQPSRPSRSMNDELTQVQREYLQKFRVSRADPNDVLLEDKMKIGRREMKMSGVESYRMNDLEKRLESVHDKFYPTRQSNTHVSTHSSNVSQKSKQIRRPSGYYQSQKKRVARPQSSTRGGSAMDMSMWCPSDDGGDSEDPLLVERMGSLVSSSIGTAKDMNLDEDEALKKIQLSFESLDNTPNFPRDASGSNLLLLVKDDIMEIEVDEIPLESVIAMEMKTGIEMEKDTDLVLQITSQ
jgi:hypothetical protein